MSSKNRQSESINNLTSAENKGDLKKKTEASSLPKESRMSHSDNDTLNCLKSDVCIQYKTNLVNCGVHSNRPAKPNKKICDEEIWMLMNCVNKCISRTEKKKLK
ncbi:hypothetical protein CDAR_540301 [Caerostris darwini]|uniref:Uncharacterized protein n=1 Tax=Caerostris darwini TaxID=1538125 RepID=A0AAV4WS71_9ARAC|nr:hypothetical protein CDAR_540301 [Caerostris darwini]